MTDWANAHVDQCCLVFERVYVQDEIEFSPNSVNKGVRFKSKIQCIDERLYESQYERIMAMRSMQAQLPAECCNILHVMLQMYKDKFGKMTMADLAEKTHISQRQLERMFGEADFRYNVEDLVLLVVALRIPKWASPLLFKAAKIHIYDEDTDDNFIYRSIVEDMYAEPI